MEMTHKEARHWIDYAADRALTAPQKLMLDAHLASCSDCLQYSKSIHKLESALRPMLQRQWDQHPTPLSIATLTAKVNTNEAARMILATRIAAIGVMFAVFMFSAWQFTISQSSRSAHPLFTSIPAIPTPATSTELVSAMTQSQTCQETIYVVDDRDTLESIAAKFSVSKQDLLRANQIEGTAVQPGMSLVIPLCHFTPTANALTTTHTPVSSPITSTPGG